MSSIEKRNDRLAETLAPKAAEESPFLDIQSFTITTSSEIETDDSPMRYRLDSPFQSHYQLEGEAVVEPEAMELEAFIGELYDDEFNDNMLELAHEAADLVDQEYAVDLGGTIQSPARVEQMLLAHYAPLTDEVERLFESIATEAEQYDFETLAGNEIETYIDRYQPRPQILAPNFENFFGKVKKWAKKKAKKLIKKGVSLAKKGIKRLAKAALRKLAKLAKPMLEKVLKWAINKLPTQYRPMARKLATKAQKYLFKRVGHEAVAPEPLYEMDGLDQIQREFDVQLAHLLFAEDEAEQETLLAEFSASSREPVTNPIGELEFQREELIQTLNQIEETDDPAPHLERFIPALLPALKMGIRLIGRPKVVKFIAKYVARLIRRLIGSKNARKLSPLIVDAGLRLINLETTDEDEAQAAGAAVAATVEETVRQVTQLPEYILNEEELLEGFVLETFERAAAANLPQILPSSVYATRPDLRESTVAKGIWVYQPLRGNKHYKKYTRVFEVLISPYAAQAVKTFGFIPLAVYLRDRLGIPMGSKVKARLHLYECIPGSTGPWLNRISRYEAHVPGLGAETSPAWPPFHPLTPEAAGILVGHSHLGRKMAPHHTTNPQGVDVGQRVYYLEIPGAHNQIMPTPDGRLTSRRYSAVNLTLDFPRDQVRAFMFLSEAESQEIAKQLRQKAPAGAALIWLRPILIEGLKAALLAGRNRCVRIIHGAVAGDQSTQALLKQLPRIVLETLVEKMDAWIGSQLGVFLHERAPEFVAATEDMADGVTVVAILRNPPGLGNLRRALGGEPVRLGDMWFEEGMPEIEMKIMAGAYRE